MVADDGLKKLYNVDCLFLLGWTLCSAVHGLGNCLFCGPLVRRGRGKPFSLHSLLVGSAVRCFVLFQCDDQKFLVENFTVEKSIFLDFMKG